jgi:hypothetical protein
VAIVTVQMFWLLSRVVVAGGSCGGLTCNLERANENVLFWFASGFPLVLLIKVVWRQFGVWRSNANVMGSAVLKGSTDVRS